MNPVVAGGFQEVPLARAPLVLVLCQLRFNAAPSLAERSTVEAIRDRLGGEYPDVEMRNEHELQVTTGPPGLDVRQKASAAHVLRSPHHPWWVLIGPAVSTLVTPDYSNRDDFVARIGAMRTALAEEGGVPAIQRIGVRYVARVAEDEFLVNLSRYVVPHMVGGTGLVLAPDAQLSQSILNVVVRWEGSVAQIRSGVVGPRTVPDPAIEPIDRSTWVLDIDVYNETYRPTDQSVEDTARSLAENQYGLFRSIVTDEFLLRFGGTP